MEPEKKKPSLKDIFANAAKSTNKWSKDLKGAKAIMIRCKNCGVARDQINQYDKCAYCDSELFERIDETQK